MQENPTFIVLEGLFSESGEFELRRGYEATHAEAGLRFGSNDRGVSVALVDEDGQILSSVAPTIHFPLGCTAEATQPGVGLLRAAVAFNHQARRIELRSNGRLIYEGEIGAERPELNGLDVLLSDNTAQVVFETGNGQTEVELLARVADGRILRPLAQSNGNEFEIDLHSLEGLGQATFIVEATSEFRTVRAKTEPIELPPASVRGMIIEPSPDSEWPFGWRGSLIGSLFDANGRRLDWAQHASVWILDGQVVANNRQLVPWEATEPGEHQIQLALDSGNGQLQILDETIITVLPMTNEQKEYFELIAARQEEYEGTYSVRLQSN